ncbi:MAG: hypothetical protein ACXADO_00780 [Candidatus Thorarchaeota archaeon]|jgi:hypothetical protein
MTVKSEKSKVNDKKSKVTDKKSSVKGKTQSTTILNLQEIDLILIDYVLKNPENVQFALKGLSKIEKDLGTPRSTLTQHFGKLKKYGIVGGSIHVSEEGKELLELVRRMRETRGNNLQESFEEST